LKVKEKMDTNYTKSVHVIKRDGQWIVRGDKINHVISIHPTQRMAIMAGRKIAQAENGELVVHRMDNRVRERVGFYSGQRPVKTLREVLFPVSIDPIERQRIQNAVAEVIKERQRKPG
jgi:hypothetical protein